MPTRAESAGVTLDHFHHLGCVSSELHGKSATDEWLGRCRVFVSRRARSGDTDTRWLAPATVGPFARHDDHRCSGSALDEPGLSVRSVRSISIAGTMPGCSDRSPTVPVFYTGIGLSWTG